MYCIKCGKEIDDDSNVCKYCGKVLNGQIQDTKIKNTKRSINGLGIAGFSTATVAFIIMFLWSHIVIFIATIVGTVLSVVGLAFYDKHSLNGFAIAGLAVGTVSLILWVWFWITLGNLLGL